MFRGERGLDLYYAGFGQLVASPLSQMDQWFTVAFFLLLLLFSLRIGSRFRHAHLHPSPRVHVSVFVDERILFMCNLRKVGK